MGSEELESRVRKVMRSVGGEVKRRLKSFERELNGEDLLRELIFCILVAGNSPRKVEKVWKKLRKDLTRLSQKELARRLKDEGYRFYNVRSGYVVEARKKIKELEEAVKSLNGRRLREWLVENFKGIGWKEASHFLRNIGFTDFAILDRHVLRLSEEYGLVEKRRTGKKFYLETEEKLRKIAGNLGISLAELDMYLFYLRTGRIPER